MIVLKMEETEGKKITIDLSWGGDTTERVENVNDVKATIFDTITQNETWMKVCLLWHIISLCGGCCFHFKPTVMLDISIPVLHKEQKLRRVG